MSETIVCSQCNSTLRLKNIPPAGSRVKCPRCEKVFVIEGEAAPKPKLTLPLSAPKPAGSPAPVKKPAPPANETLGLDPLASVGASPLDDLGSADLGTMDLSSADPFASSGLPTSGLPGGQRPIAAAQRSDDAIPPHIWWTMIGGGSFAVITLLTIVTMSVMNNRPKPAPVTAVAKAGTATPGTAPPPATIAAPAPALVIASPPELTYKLPIGTKYPYQNTMTLTMPPQLGGVTATQNTTIEFEILALDPAEATRLGSAFSSVDARQVKMTAETRVQGLPNAENVQAAAALSPLGEVSILNSVGQGADTVVYSAFEPLPSSGGETEWKASRQREFKPPGDPNPTPLTERITYRLGTLNGNLQTVQKTYETDVINRDGGTIQLKGNGSFVIDKVLGYLTEGTMDIELLIAKGNEKATIRMQNSLSYNGPPPTPPSSTPMPMPTLDPLAGASPPAVIPTAAPVDLAALKQGARDYHQLRIRLCVCLGSVTDDVTAAAAIPDLQTFAAEYPAKYEAFHKWNRSGSSPEQAEVNAEYAEKRKALESSGVRIACDESEFALQSVGKITHPAFLEALLKYAFARKEVEERMRAEDAKAQPQQPTPAPSP